MKESSFLGDFVSMDEKSKQIKTSILIIISIFSLLAVAIIAILIITNKNLKEKQQLEETEQLEEIVVPQKLLEERDTGIIPDFDYMITFQVDSATGNPRFAAMISQVAKIEGRSIVLKVKDGPEDYIFDLPENTMFYQYYEGDKENYFPATFEDIKIGSIVTYYLPWEDRGRIGSIFIRIEK